MSQPWPYPGARWWKFDFHTHTPASKDTGAWQAAIGTPVELTPQKWLLKYMAAGIDCVPVAAGGAARCGTIRGTVHPGGGGTVGTGSVQGVLARAP